MKPHIISYDPKLKKLARKLRKNSTLSETLLWKSIKKKKVLGYKFLRQKPLLNYIVDFYCPELKLVIEIDGISHEHKLKKDDKRQKELEEKGITFLRFRDKYVKENTDGAVKSIEKWIKENS